jgi:hypothetical protein
MPYQMTTKNKKKINPAKKEPAPKLLCKSAKEIAEKALADYDGSTRSSFEMIIDFLRAEPGAASPLPNSKGKPDLAVNTENYIRIQAGKFAGDRELRAPKKPETISDPVVSHVMHYFFEVEITGLERIAVEHKIAMAAENIVGVLLERYLAQFLEPLGWAWCSGSIIQAVDFVKAPATSDDLWDMLQVKNRSNSENSSSKKIRNETRIKKWHRTDAGTGQTKWDDLKRDCLSERQRPDPQDKKLTEEGFRQYVIEQCRLMREKRQAEDAEYEPIKTAVRQLALEKIRFKAADLASEVSKTYKSCDVGLVHKALRELGLEKIKLREEAAGIVKLKKTARVRKTFG